MTGPDDRLRRNNAYYDRYAANVLKRTQERDYARAFTGFTAKLHPGATVLDIGCGSGEHLLNFRGLGYGAIGIDPSARMRELASAKGFTVFDGAFEHLSKLKLPRVDGVWCAASLLHVPEDELGNALSAIRNHLSIGDPLFATVRIGTGATWDRWDAEDEAVACRGVRIGGRVVAIRQWHLTGLYSGRIDGQRGGMKPSGASLIRKIVRPNLYCLGRVRNDL